MKRAMLLAGALMLAGCTQGQMQGMDIYGLINATPSTTPGSDYTVSVKGVRSIVKDINNTAQRHEFVLEYMKPQCPNATIVDDTMISTGGIGRTYILKVKCNV